MKKPFWNQSSKQDCGQGVKPKWLTWLVSVQLPDAEAATAQLCTRQPICFRKAQRSSTLLAVAVVILTSAVGHRFYNEPKLDVGKIAPETIRAPADAQVEDTEATEEKRRIARTISGPVYVLDAQTNQQITAYLQTLLQQATSLRQTAGSFPFVPLARLSIASQIYLRQATAGEWRWVQQAASLKLPPPQPKPSTSGQVDPQFQAIVELRNYRQTYGEREFNRLLPRIDQARNQYALALKALQNPKPIKLAFDPSLLHVSDADWLKAQAGMKQVAQRMLAQGISSGLAPSLLANAARLHLDAAVPESTRVVSTQLLVTVLRPNLIEDPVLTRQREEEAALAVQPVMVSIDRGEVIVRQGDTISRTDFVLLDYFKLSRRGISWLGLMGFTFLVSGSIALFLVVQRRSHRTLSKRDYFLVLLLTVTAPLTADLGVVSISLPLIGLLVSGFYGSALGITAVTLLSGLMLVGIELSPLLLIASAAGGILSGLLASRTRSREELALLGGGVGLTQGLVYFLLQLLTREGTNWVWYAALGTSALHGLTGFAWCVIALGLSPYLEHLFDLITPIRLAELANPNRLLLKRLATETPGTFQHTLFVATLAEAAARALGCNVELVRAGTLYHDIGKMHDPQGFIENQLDGINKHDQINDPWVSAQIIKKHVTEGLVMARKCRLPRAIRAFIPEHQGTMFIGYFYHQAKERAKQDPNLTVNDDDFRYDGPIPQSRETGLVMLADSCEAALRSLKDATPEIALATVNKILKARWQDNQLVDSGLKREEMPRIAEIFVQVWQQYNHQRIAYPKAALLPVATSVGATERQAF